MGHKQPCFLVFLFSLIKIVDYILKKGAENLDNKQAPAAFIQGFHCPIRMLLLNILCCL